MNRPAWQTEELADEWPDEEEELSAEQQGTNDRAPHSDGEEDSFLVDADDGEISFTAPLPSHIHTTPSPYSSPGRAAFATSVSLRASGSFRGSRSTSQGVGYATAPVSPAGSVIAHSSRSESPRPAGTFVVRDDVPDAPMPFAQKNPFGGKNKVKDIFAPLPLERMFEPPSPPVNLNAPEIRASPIPEEPEEEPQNQDEGAQAADNPSSSTNLAPSGEGALAPPPMSRTPSPHPFTFTCTSGQGPLAQSTPYSTQQQQQQQQQPSSSNSAASASRTTVQQTPARRDNGQARLSIQTTPLRLFGQYDTYTKEHLSALADAVVPSSGASDGSSPRVGSASLSPWPDSGDHTQDRHPFGLSPITSSSTGFSQGDVGPSPPHSAREESDGRIPDKRHVKRVRLSPASDYGDEDDHVRMLRTEASYGEGAGAGASISRPRAAATPAKDFIHSPALERSGAGVKGQRLSPLPTGHLPTHNSLNRRSLNGRGSYRPSPLSSHVMVSSPSPSKGRGSQQEPTSPVLRSSVSVRPAGSDPRLPRLAVPEAPPRVSRTPSPAQGSSTESSPQKKLQGADYLQASRSLMQQIASQQKEHNFSTISSTRSGAGNETFASAGRERTPRSSLGTPGREIQQGSVIVHDDVPEEEEAENKAQRPTSSTNWYLQRAQRAMAALKDDITVSSVDTTSRRESLATHSRNPSDATSAGRQELAESTTQRLQTSVGMTVHIRTETGMTGTTLGSSLRKSSSNALAASTSRPRVPSTRRVVSASTQRTVSGSSDATALDPGPSNKPPSFSSSMRSSFSRVPSDNAPPSLGSAPSDATVADPIHQTGGTATRDDLRRFVSAASTNGTAATVESGVKHGSFGNVTGAAQPRRGFIPAQGYNTGNLAPPNVLVAPPSPADPRTAALGELSPQRPSNAHPSAIGPRAGRRITTIAPSDLGMPIPERVGTMVFDHATGRWVRQGHDSSDDTTDVFGDIDSLRSGDNASVSGFGQSTSSTESRSLPLPDASGYADQDELLHSHLPESSFLSDEYLPQEEFDIDISSEPPTGHVVPVMTGQMSFIDEEEGEYVDYSYMVQQSPGQEQRYSSFTTSSSDSDVDDVTHTDRPYLEQQQQLAQFRARTRAADASSDSTDAGDEPEPYAHVEEIMDDEDGFDDDLPPEDDEEEEEDDDDTERPHLYAPKPEHPQTKIEEVSPAGLGYLAPPSSSHPGSSPMSQSPSVGTLRSALKSNPLNSGAQASQPSGSDYAGRDRRPHRRSVSFSDGRLDGPILGLGDSTSSADTQDNDQAVEGDEDDEVWLEQSTRTNRLLRDLQGLALEDSVIGEPDAPQRNRSFQRTISSSALQFNGDDADASSGPRHSFSRLGPDTSSSHSMRVTSVVVDVSPSAFPVPPGRPLSHEERVLRTQTNTPNVTRGTAMSAFPSFSLARSALIRALTDVVPFIPYWDTLREVDLTVLGAPEENAGPTTGAPRDGSGAAGMEVRRQQAAREERDEDDTGSTNRDAEMSLAASGEMKHGRRGQKLESLVGLEDCCPVLVGVRVANNALTYLTGLPRTVLRLDAAHNQLSETTSFGECCARVEALDVRGNRLAGGADNLAPLQALRTLDASKNRLTSVAGLQRLRNLVRLDLHGNRIEGKVQIGDWPKLEYLNLSDNKITHLEGLERMPALVVLDIDNNDLAELVLPRGALTRLRILRLSGNARVRRVDGVDRLPSLRVFYADGCRMEVGALVGAESNRDVRADRSIEDVPGGPDENNLSLRRAPRLSDLDLRRSSSSGATDGPRTASGSSARRWPVKLENLSLRNQCRERGAARKRRDAVDLMALTSDVRDVKRLYLSGNAISYSPASRAVPCYSLVYLELAACRLTALPDAFAGLFPNVRVLNLNYNFLADPEAAKLRGLVRLRRLSMVGGRVGDAKVLVGIVSGMHEVESVDFRMNPCTLGWYLPLLVKDVPGALSPSAAGEWAEMDAKFRRDLPDEAYIGRLAYRGLMMQRCGQLRTLDGVGVTEKESRKAGRLLSAVRGAGTAGTGATGGGGSGSAAATAAGAGTTAGTGPGRA